MSENTTVEVPYGDDVTKTAQDLLGSAEALGLDPSVVQSSPLRGAFIVPQEVADEVGSFYEGKDEDDDGSGEVKVDGPAAGGDAEKALEQQASGDVPQGEAVEPKALADLSSKELDDIAAAEDIDLTGAKTSKAAKAERIEQVRAERTEAEADKNAAEAAGDGDTPDGSDTPDADDETKE